MAKEVAILGVGMHPWGKWGRNFVEYGVKAARDAIADAGLEWKDIQFVSGGDTVRNGYPGYVAGATFAQALGWTGAPVCSSYGACASGAQAINTARTQILAGLCDVGEGEKLLRNGDTTIGGRIPVNPSGGLACFGEAVPAQAIAQVCEITWQLRGQAEGRQVEGARVGITANQGLFGHGSSVLLARS